MRDNWPSIPLSWRIMSSTRAAKVMRLCRCTPRSLTASSNTKGTTIRIPARGGGLEFCFVLFLPHKYLFFQGLAVRRKFKFITSFYTACLATNYLFYMQSTQNYLFQKNSKHPWYFEVRPLSCSLSTGSVSKVDLIHDEG